MGNGVQYVKRSDGGYNIVPSKGFIQGENGAYGELDEFMRELGSASGNIWKGTVNGDTDLEDLDEHISEALANVEDEDEREALKERANRLLANVHKFRDFRDDMVEASGEGGGWISDKFNLDEGTEYKKRLEEQVNSFLANLGKETAAKEAEVEGPRPASEAEPAEEAAAPEGTGSGFKKENVRPRIFFGEKSFDAEAFQAAINDGGFTAQDDVGGLRGRIDTAAYNNTNDAARIAADGAAGTPWVHQGGKGYAEWVEGGQTRRVDFEYVQAKDASGKAIPEKFQLVLGTEPITAQLPKEEKPEEAAPPPKKEKRAPAESGPGKRTKGKESDDESEDEPLTKGDLKELAKMLRSQSTGGSSGGMFPTNTDNPDINALNNFTNTTVAASRAMNSFGLLGTSTAGAGGAWLGPLGAMGGPFQASVAGPGGAFSYGYGPSFAPWGGGSFVGTASAGTGFGGGYVFDLGTYGTTGMITADMRDRSRKIEALINFLIMQILLGNTDAITSALIAISRKSKETLIRSSVAMLSAMKQYDMQQDELTKQFQKIQFDPKNPQQFQHESSRLSMQLNSIAVARQMMMNQMRDVMTMSEEIGNVEKSILDITGQFKRSYSRFNV